MKSNITKYQNNNKKLLLKIKLNTNNMFVLKPKTLLISITCLISARVMQAWSQIFTLVKLIKFKKPTKYVIKINQLAVTSNIGCDYMKPVRCTYVYLTSIWLSLVSCVSLITYRKNIRTCQCTVKRFEFVNIGSFSFLYSLCIIYLFIHY